MRFGQRHSIRNNLKPPEFVRGIWNPRIEAWRDVIEDYLYISKKRLHNKLSIFKLQLNLFQDLLNNIRLIESCENLKEKLSADKKDGNITEEQFSKENEFLKSELFSYNIINKALREIADGIVWKYFKYNRAMLYMLADKEPIESIRQDTGTLNNLYEFSDVFLKPDTVAIYNDITNFLRVGDITQIDQNGDIEIIEVKTSKRRGARITRQKQRMVELVDFFNTGITDYDGKKLKIIYSNKKQKTYLKLLSDAIRRSRNKGYESLLLGKYLILEIVDVNKAHEMAEFLEFFKSKHKSIQDEWKQNNDFVHDTFFLDKMDYSKNCAPFSIYPFDIGTCTDIMTGRLIINARFNYSEVLRIIKKAGWEIIDALIYKTEEELKALRGQLVSSVPFLTIRKESLTMDVPPNLFARMHYELLSPSTLIENFEETLKRGPQNDYDYCLTNYLDEEKLWS